MSRSKTDHGDRRIHRTRTIGGHCRVSVPWTDPGEAVFPPSGGGGRGERAWEGRLEREKEQEDRDKRPHSTISAVVWTEMFPFHNPDGVFLTLRVDGWMDV